MKIYQTEQKHWVGNGFYVSNLLPGYEKNMGSENLPFLMIDYQSPKYFAPTSQRLWVGTHPHKGFETLTIVYSGWVEHRDSKWNGGIIGPWEAQWMTAWKGIAHSEFYHADFLKEWWEAEFAQIWIKLPPNDELTEPKYQAITQKDVVVWQKDIVNIRLFAGEYEDLISKTHTFSPLIVADIQWIAKGKYTLRTPTEHSTYILVRKWQLSVDGRIIPNGSLISLETWDEDMQVDGDKDTEILLLSGKPWDEKIYHYGPFVLHDQNELFQTLGKGI